jgi:hypothetical protein
MREGPCRSADCQPQDESAQSRKPERIHAAAIVRLMHDDDAAGVVQRLKAAFFTLENG